MLLTVITPTLNAAAAAAATHASLKGLEDWVDWVVQDGASTDGTQQVLQGLQNPAPQIDTAPDKGLYDAMNRGLARAGGAYVVFVGAGDRLAPADALRALRATLTNGPDLVFGAAQEDGVTACFQKPARPVGSIWRGMPTHHPAMVFRRALVAGLAYDVRFQVAADYAFAWAALDRAKTVVTLQTPICRCAPAGVSARLAPIGRREQAQIRRDHGIPWPVPTAIAAAQAASWALRRTTPQLWQRLRAAAVPRRQRPKSR